MSVDDMPTESSVRRSAWREPMVWLVALIPLAAIAGTLWMVLAASTAPGNDDAVADPVRRTAQVQQADLGPDARADAMHLSAIVRRSVARGRQQRIEVLPVDGDFGAAPVLSLALRHPSRADGDHTLLLKRTETGWRGEADFDITHDWNLQLAPADGAWRLQGRWPARQQAAYLRPALSAEAARAP
jgi:uncharacterized protein